MLDPKKAFHGVFGFPVTPFQNDLSLDLAGLERNCDWMAGFPFCSQVIAGGSRVLKASIAHSWWASRVYR